MGPLSAYKKSKSSKNESKKKKKDSDFKKVKITPGKKVKRLDDTRTDFKSRKIHINEAVSLQTGASKVLLNKNLKINSRLKISAFEKLNSNFDSLDPDSMTGETINGLAKYLLDPNEKVREEFIRSVKKSLDILASRGVHLSPYLQILLIYIKCGLTHIDRGVNYDARRMFNYVLDRCDEQTERKLIDVVYSKMKSGMHRLFNSDLEMIWNVLKKVQPKLQTDQNQNSAQGKQLLWSTENESNCCELFANRTYGSHQFDFSFTRFDEKEEIVQDFVQTIDSYVQKEISTRKWNKWVFTREETKRVRFLLELALLRKIQLPVILNPIDVFITDEHSLISKDAQRNVTNKKELAALKNRVQLLANKLKTAV